VSLTNPKVMLFFVAFFPLFLKPSASPVTLGMMMVHVSVISFVYQAILVLLGNWLAQQFKGVPQAQIWAKRLAGAALVGFALKLAANNR
jgi:threonine/homoserine/homoserine lactone efflux protein